MGYIHRPQRVWWRKVLFQVHLWVGLILGLYMIVIGVTGSILVFKDELASLSYPQLMTAARGADPISRAQLTTVIDNARAAHPDLKLVGAYVPGVFGEQFLAYMEGPEERWVYVFADPEDGHVTGSLDLKSTWLFWISDLHIRLLAGNTGWIANGIGAGFLVLLCATGLVLWWPGIKAWPRALAIKLHRGWKRINFDLHSALGFWALTILLMWALSGVYFVFPKQFEALVNVISPVEAGVEPQLKVSSKTAQKSSDVKTILAQARAASPAGKLSGIYIPEAAERPITVFVARGRIEDFSQADRVYFDPTSGAQLGLWHAGINPTLGSKFVYWLGPLHFGVYWGLAVKVLWAAVGLSLPVLTVTGALMYWNRSLSKYWARWANSRSGSQEEVQLEVKQAS